MPCSTAWSGACCMASAQLLEVASDPLVHRLDRMARTIRRDLHKMHAFLRFRRVEGEDRERFVAWFEPDHFILEATAQFFVDRFRSLDWTILTPIGSMRWDRATLVFGPPARPRGCADRRPVRGGLARLLREHLQSRAGQPEGHARRDAEKILAQHAGGGLHRGVDTGGAAADGADDRPGGDDAGASASPSGRSRPCGTRSRNRSQELNAIIARAGPLVPGATQPVFGEGPAACRRSPSWASSRAIRRICRAGRSWAPPASCWCAPWARPGSTRDTVYLTNAVKHFKFEERGKRRIHAKPTAGEVRHYRPLLMKELDLVQPRLVVALGGTALLALSGKALPVTKARGPAHFENRPGYVTVHPSYLLRIPDEADKRQAYEDFVGDLARDPRHGGRIDGSGATSRCAIMCGRA